MLEGGKPATAAGGQAHRPLPLVPVLHDDLPVRRALHAPRRPCPRLYRGDLRSAPGTTASCAALLARILPYPNRFRLALLGGAARQAARGAACGSLPCVGNRLAGDARPRARAAAVALALRPARRVRRPRASAAPRRAAARLRPARAEARASTRPPSASSTGTASRSCSPKGEGCCGALVHHMGRDERRPRLRQAQHRRLDRARWTARASTPSSITASGCGTTIKDYGFMFRDDPAYAEKARARLGDRQGHHRVHGEL